MHHAVLDRWSRGASFLHRADPRAKIIVLLVFLVVLATAHRRVELLALALFLTLGVALRVSRLPIAGAILRAGVVLPFTGVFALLCWAGGDAPRAVAILLKSYLSALAVLATVATTPLPLLLRGLEVSGAPRFLLMVAQFIYRYLFVISEEAQHMSKAAASRGASISGLAGNGARFRAAAGALAVLFARSYGRAGDVHRAMLARGFAGHLPTLSTLHFRAADAIFALGAGITPVLMRLAIERGF